ncbi:MAG: glycosyltransferase family 2 protein [Anaerolineae bacterium]
MENLRVSIVTPSFNQGEFIEETILSVSGQTYPHIEHLIVDGGSTDHTLDVLRTYEGAYNMRWISEPDEGQSDALNKGFEMASGDVIGWINSDDVYFSPDAVSTVARAFVQNPGADVVCGDLARINERGQLMNIYPYNSYVIERHFPQPSTFFRKHIVEKHRLDTSLKFCMDRDFFIRLKRDYRFHHVCKVLACLRMHTATKFYYLGAEGYLKERALIDQRYGLRRDARFWTARAVFWFLRLRGYLLKLRLAHESSPYHFPFITTHDNLASQIAADLRSALGINA